MRRLIGIAALVAVLTALWVPSVANANDDVAFVKETGHHVSGAFRAFWERNGGPDILGYPITEEMSQGGLAVQYFQRARMEYRDGAVGLGLLADQLGKGQPGGTNPMPAQSGADFEFFPETGHLVSGGFLRHFKNQGGVGIYGYPISTELSEAGKWVQYFQRGRMEWTGSSVELGFLGQEVASLRGLNTASVPQTANVAVWAPPKPAAVVAAAPQGPGAGAGKTIVMSLSQQHLWAYQDGALVLSTPITTGAAYTPTLAGNFAVQSKHTPFLFVSPWGRGDSRYYEPSWTTYSMLYAAGGYYIHDAPWRAAYGPGTNANGSHGCVNVPFAAMEKLFFWSTPGTQVRIN